MQVIAASAPVTRSDRLAVFRSALAAVLLLLAGALIGWLCLSTPVLGAFVPNGRPSVLEVVTGVAVWGFAIVIPASFLILGVARIMSTFEAATALKPRAASNRLARTLGPDHLAVTDLVLPGGRSVHELVLGPFGVAVLTVVPPRHLSRHVGSRWEMRDERGRWIPIEAPLDRATRDAERVRGWLSSDDRDFLVRVYAAVITSETDVERGPACAVVAPGDLEAWFAALPAQRGLTAERRERLAAMIRSIATSQR